MQTILGQPHIDPDGVIAFRDAEGHPAHLLYCVAQQAMLGRWAAERYMNSDRPYAEHVDLDVLPSPADDPAACAAARWLVKHACRIGDDAVVWPHRFAFTYADDVRPLEAGWASGVGQAEALLACLHWWRHTRQPEWQSMAAGVVRSFCLSTAQGGVAADLGQNACWFEEYPTDPPPQILNCHLLALLALDRAAELLESASASQAFDRGWLALQQRIDLYDRGDWSRYDSPQRIYMLMRLVPASRGQVALASAALEDASGKVLARVDAQEGSHDRPISRLAGCDWGEMARYSGQAGRLVPNRREHYAQAGIPAGGTDQNTYLAFEQVQLAPEQLGQELRLRMKVFCSWRAALAVEFQDPRDMGLSFRTDPAAGPISRRGWRGWSEVVLNQPPRLVGRPVPRHYHRLHTELLGSLLRRHPDQRLDGIFRRWHAADLHDTRYIPPDVPPRPHNVYVIVNDRCNMRCRMCDVGQGQSDSFFHSALSGHGRQLDLDLLLRALPRRTDGQPLTCCFVGTEPLLFSRCAEAIGALKAHGIRTGITTNGFLLPQYARKLAEAGLDDLNLSIDGPPQVHDAIRGCAGLFERVVQGVAEFRSACKDARRPEPHIYVNCTISRDNHRHITSFLDAIRPLGPKAVYLTHLNFVAPFIAERHNQEYPGLPTTPTSVSAWEEAQKIDFLELFRQLQQARKTPWTEVCEIPHCPTPTRLQWYYRRPELPMSRNMCAAPWNAVQILCDGTVTVLARCYQRTMGRLGERTLEQIWLGAPYEDFRRFLREHQYLEPCLRCCGSL